MQRFFHDELRQLRDDLILMGERSLDMTRLVLRAVETGDDSLALQVRGMDDRVDELEKRVAAHQLDRIGQVGQLQVVA